MRARIAASSGLFALNREISVCAGLRGGAGRTRTSDQTIISGDHSLLQHLILISMGCARRACRVSLNPSTRPSPTAWWAWASRSAALDYRSPWWAAVGDQVRAAGCSRYPAPRPRRPPARYFTVLMCNSRLPSSAPLIDWMALTIKFNITCCSCTRSHWMRGNSPASCVPTVTPVLTASLRVRAVTSRIAALRSTASFRAGAFLMRDPIRSTTSLARSASFTMQVSASLEMAVCCSIRFVVS